MKKPRRTKKNLVVAIVKPCDIVFQRKRKMTTRLTTTSRPLLELTDELHRSVIRVLELGLARSRKTRGKTMFYQRVNELVDETMRFFVCLKKSCKNGNIENARSWLLSLQWAVFSMAIGSGCFLLMRPKTMGDEELFLIKSVNKCLEMLLSIVLKVRVVCGSGDTRLLVTNDETTSSLLTRFCRELEESGMLEEELQGKLAAEVDELRRHKQELETVLSSGKNCDMKGLIERKVMSLVTRGESRTTAFCNN